jgi:hypothetical protein
MSLFDLTGISGITDVLKSLIELFPNAEQRAAAANKIQDVEAAIAAAQSATNTAEASNPSIFVAGWRPACGWICVMGLGYSCLIAPPLHLPQGDMGTLISILGGMLGLGTMRTFEKISGVPDTKIGKLLGRK